MLAIKKGLKVVPSEQWCYHDYYDIFAEDVKKGGRSPINEKIGVRTLAILGGARLSALKGRIVKLEES